MKHILHTLLLFLFCTKLIYAADVSSLSWAQVCAGKMDAEWYASTEAQQIADIVLSVQKNSGGWMKNDQLHKLSESELDALRRSRNQHSCLDNSATTQEMRFLAKVYQGTKVEAYRESFLKALQMIFEAEKSCGGWSQYWPLNNDGGYSDYITFNDDLVTNVLMILRDINRNKGDFAEMADDSLREHCQQSFDRTIDMIIRCQVDDNGVKAAWCAQHDTLDLLPTEGRPHELPSISGFESANLLSFLMTIDNPSSQLQECITSAVTWLDAHKIVDKAVEDFVNENGDADRRIVDRQGSNLWGRFIQLGGEQAEVVYNKLFEKLRNRGKTRSYTYEGKTYTYSEYEIAASSYNPAMAYQPIYAIYKNEYAHLFYRFLYNYADTEPVIDEKGCPVATSLMATNRASYQYIGNWCQSVIEVEYPAWKERVESMGEEKDVCRYELSAVTFESESDDNTYYFDGGFSVSNQNGKKYGKGKSNTIKYSANVPYTIHLPEGMQVVKASFYGYSNYDADAYLASINDFTFSETDYVFPAKVTDPVYVSHTIDLSADPATGQMTFTMAVKQCCLLITLYCSATTAIRLLPIESQYPKVACIDGHLNLICGNQMLDLLGRTIR